jgi:nicotinate-nucleotide pyrophosphorylase (carboxylating)
MKYTPNQNQIHDWIEQGLKEDLGTGDITTDSIVSEDLKWEAEIIAKEPIVVCGIEFFKETFLSLDEKTLFSSVYSDGEWVESGVKLLKIEGKARVLLKGERTALNILQRLSGIATISREFSELAGSVKILDTRKTTPGLRIFEKYAVACGGGENHRFGLFDAVLIKDNHIRAAGSISKAVARARNKLNDSYKIEVEVSNLEEVNEALGSEVDRIMLDNMSIEEMRVAIKKIDGQAEIEVSGGVDKEIVGSLSSLKIDYISIGALTHSPKAADISMNFL